MGGLLGAVGLKLDPDKEKKSMRFTPGESQLLPLFLYFFNAAVIGIVLLKHVSILHTELHEEEMTCYKIIKFNSSCAYLFLFISKTFPDMRTSKTA